MVRGLAVLCAVTLGACLCGGKTYTRCELVEELKRLGFREDNLPCWICMIEAESGRRTDMISRRLDDGTRNHGLFQINDNNKWCADDTHVFPGYICKAFCRDFRDENITRAAECALKIWHTHGFGYWYGFRSRCRNVFVGNKRVDTLPVIKC